MKYPKTIYIQRDPNSSNDENECLLAWENAENAEDGKVAVYELKKMVSKRTDITLE